MGMCELLAKRSPCMSRQIGAVIVRNNILLAMGYNGPPRGIKHCNQREYMELKVHEATRNGQCPRQAMGFKSGEGIEHCPAEHAERNAIIHATITGTNLEGSTMYCNCGVCCLECSKAIIQAGINRVILNDFYHYDLLGMKLLREAGILVYVFDGNDCTLGDLYAKKKDISNKSCS
jgi:dCMP deaminase